LPAIDALAIFAAFDAHQLGQKDSGESWPRIAGELMEFAGGMALGRFTDSGGI
jgi:hypothetical protein